MNVQVEGWVDPVSGAEVHVTLARAPKRSSSVYRWRQLFIDRIADGKFADSIRRANGSLAERIERNAQASTEDDQKAARTFARHPPADRLHILELEDIDRLWTPIMSELLPVAVEELSAMGARHA